MSTTQITGSFRGVPFGLLSHSMEGGRRTVTHEFPGRDNPYTEDLGRKARAFSLDLFVLGDDVSAQRDALRKALEQKGPGVLIHPYLGTLTVQVGNFTLSESYEEQRLAKFNVGFIQPGKLEFPAAIANPSGTVSNASTSASLQAGANALAIDITSATVGAAFSTLIGSTSALIQTSAQRAAQPNSLPLASDSADAIQAMSSFMGDSKALPSLSSTPDLMSYSTADVVFRLSSLGMTSLQAFFAYQRLLSDVQGLFASQNFPATAIGATMAANAALYQDVVFAAIVGSAAANAVDASFTTYDQAVSVRESLSSMFDVAMGVVLDDTLFGYLQDLKASSLNQIPPPGQDLPNVVSIQTPAPLPSLVLAFDLMNGSVDEQTLIDLNGAGNPWWIPASNQPVLILQ